MTSCKLVMCMAVHEVRLDSCFCSVTVPRILQWWDGFQEGSKQERCKKKCNCTLCDKVFILYKYCTSYSLAVVWMTVMKAMALPVTWF